MEECDIVAGDDDDADPDVNIKVGESKEVYGRWNSCNGHISTSPNARLYWAATPLTPLITGQHIQAKLKQVLRSQWCVDRGVRLTANNTQGEEFRCPLSAYLEVLYTQPHKIGTHVYESCTSWPFEQES
jgi:hypothetical protein